MKVFRNNEDAFTGLEAAIVLIAFVVVAAVFSYVVLGAGFFTTQKSQETVHSGVAMASSAVEVLGDVYGIADNDGDDIKYIQFTVGLAAGASTVDMNKTVMVFSTNATVETLDKGTDEADPTAKQWTILERHNSLGGLANNMLEKDEQFVLKVMPTNSLAPYTSFNLEVKPPVGAALGIKRSIPAYTHKSTLLY
ncbi:MAG TPA: flagellin [Methanoregulaceae archaeon]|nr:flagellin [Methanoregulaceae archaeon]